MGVRERWGLLWGNRAQGLTKAHVSPEEEPKRPTEMRRMH